METTVQKNQVYAFRTLGTKKGDPNTYLIQAVDQPNSPVYETPKLKEYALSTPPAQVYCRLRKDGAHQSGWRQDWKYTLDLLFPEDRPYDFKVVEVLVRTFASNSNEKVALGMVASTEYKVTGGIRNGGYIKGAYLTNLAEIFDKESFLLHASTMTDLYGHLSFNVSKEIADYSCRRASEVDASALAVCIGNNRLTGWSTFVTESGVVVLAKSPMIAIIGRTYAI